MTINHDVLDGLQNRLNGPVRKAFSGLSSKPSSNMTEECITKVFDVSFESSNEFLSKFYLRLSR